MKIALIDPRPAKIVPGSEDYAARSWNAEGSGAPVVFEGEASAAD